jgi:hypothetical protein
MLESHGAAIRGFTRTVDPDQYLVWPASTAVVYNVVLESGGWVQVVSTEDRHRAGPCG